MASQSFYRVYVSGSIESNPVYESFILILHDAPPLQIQLSYCISSLSKFTHGPSPTPCENPFQVDNPSFIPPSPMHSHSSLQHHPSNSMHFLRHHNTSLLITTEQSMCVVSRGTSRLKWSNKKRSTVKLIRRAQIREAECA